MLFLLDVVDLLFLCNLMFFCFLVVDTNDRFLRKITIGQASTEKGQIREVCSNGYITIFSVASAGRSC